MEIAELPKDKHPFYARAQQSSRISSYQFAPHPLFSAFKKAWGRNNMENLNNKENKIEIKPIRFIFLKLTKMDILKTLHID